MKLRTPYSLNEIGQRANQEDSIFPAKGVATEESRLFLVCDGMGGHENGEVASGLVCSTFGQRLNNIDHDNFTTEMFLESLSAAYDALDREDPNPESTRKMGTTLTFLHIGRSEVTVAHMGDSRVYHVRPNSATPILYKSNDHSLVNELVRAEIITPEEALTHPRRNVITRAMQPNLETRHKADVRVFPDVEAGDYFFLCSDGVLETITDDILVEVLSRNVSDAEKIETIRAMCQANSRDNFSAYLVPIAEGTGYVAPIESGVAAMVSEVSASEIMETQLDISTSPNVEHKSSAAQAIDEVKVPKRKVMLLIGAVIIGAIVGLVGFMFIPNEPKSDDEGGVSDTIVENSTNVVTPDERQEILGTVPNDGDNSNDDNLTDDDDKVDNEDNASEPEPEPAVPAPVMRLTSNSSVTVAHSGVNGEIRYAIENQVDGQRISVSDDASWITTRALSAGVIAYTATPNNSQSQRTATITVTYGDQSFEVAIAQSGRPAPTPEPTPTPTPDLGLSSTSATIMPSTVSSTQSGDEDKSEEDAYSESKTEGQDGEGLAGDILRDVL